eukprot:4101252-Amphidinium_carterae.3
MANYQKPRGTAATANKVLGSLCLCVSLLATENGGVAARRVEVVGALSTVPHQQHHQKVRLHFSRGIPMEFCSSFGRTVSPTHTQQFGC